MSPSAFGNISWLLLIYFVTKKQCQEDRSRSPPIIKEHPADTIVIRGEPVTLKCEAGGSPTPEIIWYREEIRVEASEHRVFFPTGSLFFLRVHSGKNGHLGPDSGTYWCVARNSEGEDRSRNASLKIAMLREDFHVRPRNVQAVVGQPQIMIECVPPRGFPEPIVTWRKDGRDIRPKSDPRITVHSSGNIIITKVQQRDRGFYTCVARNMVGERESPAGKLSVYEKPSFITRPSQLTVDTGHDIVFPCRVTGDPMPVIVWRKRNGKMPLGRAQIIESKGLRVDRVIPSDEGEYVCQAKNPAGTIEATARLVVHAPPRKPTDQELESGQKVAFDCEAIGNPQPSKFWTREGHQALMFPGYRSASGRIQVAESGRLVISGVAKRDEGFYICSAMNAAGSAVHKVRLKVNDGESITLLSEPPPIIIYGPANQTLPTGGLALLPCQAQGRTQPIILWTKNGKTLETDSKQMERYSQLASGALRIDKLEPGDSGYYTCHAENKDGQTVWTAQLNVEEPTNPSAHFHRMADPSTYPTQPGKPVLLNATDTSVTLKWTKPAKQGASPITGYIVQYYSPEQGQTWYNVQQERKTIRNTGPYTIQGLKPGAVYVFIVRAENSEGIGQPSTMSSVIRTTGKVKSSEDIDAVDGIDLELARNRLGSGMLIRLLEVTALNSTAVQLFWRPNRNEPLVQGYYIKWKGPKTPDGLQYMNVTRADTRSWIIDKLEPFAEYTFFVLPYYRSIEGIPSNSISIRTQEARPLITPKEVTVRMMNLTTLRISWRPPSDKGLNGKLSGYNVVARGNCSKCYRNISTNERAASVTLFHLRRAATYEVMVAAVNAAGIGKYHIFDPIVLDENTLKSHLALFAQRYGSKNGGGAFTFLRLISSPWFIALIGVILWIFLFFLIVLIWYCNKKRTLDKQKSSSAAYLSTPFIKINDASVVTPGREQLWLDHHSTLNSAQLMVQNNNNNNNGSTTNISKNPDSQQIFDDLRINSDGVIGFYGTQPINIVGSNNEPAAEKPGQQTTYDVANTSEAPTTLSHCRLNNDNAQDAGHNGATGYSSYHPDQDLESSFYHQLAPPPPPTTTTHHFLSTTLAGCERGESETTSPTPYATTTLVMDGHRDNILNELRLHAPTLPHSNPPKRPHPSSASPRPNDTAQPPQPSPRHSRTLNNINDKPEVTAGDLSAPNTADSAAVIGMQQNHHRFSPTSVLMNNPNSNSNDHHVMGYNNYHKNYNANSQNPASPPNTDISYVPLSSADSQDGQSSSSSHHRRNRPPRSSRRGDGCAQPELFIPPPPQSSPPPPEDQQLRGNRQCVQDDEEEKDYQTLNQLLKSFHSSDPLESQQQQLRAQNERLNGSNDTDATDRQRTPSKTGNKHHQQRTPPNNLNLHQALYNHHPPQQQQQQQSQQSRYPSPNCQNHYNHPASSGASTTARESGANTNSLNDVHALINNSHNERPKNYKNTATIADMTSPEISDLDDAEPTDENEACHYSACHEFTQPDAISRRYHQPLKIMAAPASSFRGSRETSPRLSSHYGDIVSPRSGGAGGTLGRPNQPVMGINATTLSVDPNHQQRSRLSSPLSPGRSSPFYL